MYSTQSKIMSIIIIITMDTVNSQITENRDFGGK